MEIESTFREVEGKNDAKGSDCLSQAENSLIKDPDGDPQQRSFCPLPELDVSDIIKEREIEDDNDKSVIDIELLSQYSWSYCSLDDVHRSVGALDELGSIGVDDDGLGIQSSIDAIQEEVSRLDAALAMDEVRSLKHELAAVKRQLADKKAEVKEKREIIRRKDERLAKLELERDLYRADARKLKGDLHIKAKEYRKEQEEIKDQRQDETADEQPLTPSLSAGSSGTNPVLSDTSPFGQFPGEDTSDRQKTWTNRTEYYQLLLAPHSKPFKHRVPRSRNRFETPPWETFTETDESSLLLSQASSPDSYFDRYNFYGEPKQVASDIVAQKGKHGKRNVTSSSISVSRRSLRRLICPRNHHREQGQTDDPKSKSEQIEMTKTSLEDQVQHLQHRLNASIESTDDLKKRLASVSLYYENALHSQSGSSGSALNSIDPPEGPGARRDPDEGFI